MNKLLCQLPAIHIQLYKDICKNLLYQCRRTLISTTSRISICSTSPGSAYSTYTGPVSIWLAPSLVHALIASRWPLSAMRSRAVGSGWQNQLPEQGKVSPSCLFVLGFKYSSFCLCYISRMLLHSCVITSLVLYRF